MRRTLTAIVAALTIILSGVSEVDAQRAEPEFLWLSPSTWAVNQKGLLRDLQAAADRGYRLAPQPSAAYLLLVQKSVDPEPVEYIFAGDSNDMDEKAAIGYRLVNNYVMVRRKGNTTRTHEYTEVATRLRQSMENELLVATMQGFRVVSLGLRPVIGWRSFLTSVDDMEFVATLERPVNAADATHPEYMVLATVRAATMQTELQAAADRGYRLLPFEGHWGATVLLEKFADAEPVEYLVLSTAKVATMQAEMRKAAATGYRFAGTLGTGAREFVVVMQRTKGVHVRTHEHEVQGTQRMRTMQRESLALMEKGFRVVGFTNSAGLTSESIAILERPVP